MSAKAPPVRYLVARDLQFRASRGVLERFVPGAVAEVIPEDKLSPENLLELTQHRQQRPQALPCRLGGKLRYLTPGDEVEAEPLAPPPPPPPLRWKLLHE